MISILNMSSWTSRDRNPDSPWTEVNETLECYKEDTVRLRRELENNSLIARKRGGRADWRIDQAGAGS